MSEIKLIIDSSSMANLAGFNEDIIDEIFKSYKERIIMPPTVYDNLIGKV